MPECQPPDIAMTQQAASPIRNSVFRKMFTAGKQNADGASELPGDSYSDEDRYTRNWEWKSESEVSSRRVNPPAYLELINFHLKDNRFGQTPTPDAVSTPKRKHSPENDEVQVDQALARSPTSKKVKYSQSFVQVSLSYTRSCYSSHCGSDGDTLGL